MTGKTFLHYIIEDKLGESGAGTVYRAHDTMKVRVVTLRFLPSFVAEDPDEKSKIVAELRAAAELNNPSTCKVFDVFESEEGMVVEMEFVEGTTLRERMKQAGAKYGESLALRTVAAYSLQIASSLLEAQQRNIFHGCLKPENVFVTPKDQIKVMDLGLSRVKALAAARRTSTKVDDVAYQAPELLKGGEADARTDVFAFGVMYYEMLTTRRPFHGDHEAAMRYAIENDEHDELSKYRPEISLYAVFIVDNALPKNPVERYQSMRELITHLEYWREELSGMKAPAIKTTPAAATPKATPSPDAETPKKKAEQKEMPAWMAYASYAVTGIIFVTIIIGGIMWYDANRDEPIADPAQRLPVVVADVENATNDPNLSTLAGMFTTALEQSRHLNVLSRARLHDILKSMGRDTVTMIDERQGSEICGHARIHALVVASIGKSLDQYTMLVKVIDPAKNEYLYTDKEDGAGEASIPSMIDKLSTRIRAGLREYPGDIGSTNPAAASLITANFAAYTHYYRGERCIDRGDNAGAQKEMKQAIALDPAFGLAYARLIYAISGDGRFTDPSEKELAAKGMLYVTHIPERQRYLFDATMALQNDGYVTALDTLLEMETAYPDDKEMIGDIGDWSYHAGDFGSADKYLSMMLHIEPGDTHAQKLLTLTYSETNRYKDMLAEARVYAAAAHSEESSLILARAFGENRMFGEGIAEMRKFLKASPTAYAYRGAVADLDMLAGAYDSASTELAELASLSAPSTPLATKKIAFEGLSRLALYEGRYGDALRAYDERAQTNAAMGDTASLIVSLLQRSMCMALMGGDATGARAELYKALWFPPQFRTQTFMEDAALTDALIGDFGPGDNIVSNALDADQLRDWWLPMYRLVTNSTQGSCDDAIAEGDSVLATGDGTAKMWASYFKGVCLLASGRFDDAARSLRQTDSTYEDEDGLRGIFHSRSLYLIGKAYQAKGDTAAAKAAYKKFLDVWKNADSFMPAYKDAEAQLASLGK